MVKINPIVSIELVMVLNHSQTRPL